jgi:hypothetical protein
MDPSDTLVGTAGKFPFVMVISSTFLDGSFFLVFNIPIIASCLLGSSFSGINDLLKSGAIPIWSGIVKSMDGIALVTLFLLLSILAGIFLAPFSRGVAFAGSKLVATLFSLANKDIKIFSSADFLSPKNADLLSWFLEHPAKKLHWEWELFGYYVYWGAFLNVATFCIVSTVLLWHGVGAIVPICFLIVSLLFLGFAIAKSKAMGEVHAFYRKQFEDNTRIKQIGIER